ncbi:MAG: ABC-2 family transporter protein [Verrucomicrobia bacterium]|nr:ABC-2 family transporter protein [Verrucomicrobiota bacterium]MBS0636613.1 ABC-2 family transporter protein [Verrucomicrobiota bacterium]
MQSYIKLFATRIHALFQYRVAALAGIATQVFWGLLYTIVIGAFYSESPESSPIALQTAISFVWINQAFWLLVPWNVDKRIEGQVLSGAIAYELIRPLDLYWVWFWRSLAFRIVPTIMRSLPIFIVAGLFFGLERPASGLFFLSLLFSTLLSSAMTTIVMISLFWTLSGEGILRLLPHMAVFLSGLVVPIPFFPDWMQPFMLAQPFRAVVDIPCRFYTGLIPFDECGYYFAIQLGWALFFILAGRWLMDRALKKVVIQGG